MSDSAMERAATETPPARGEASGAVGTLKRRADFLRVAKGVRRHCGAFSIQAAPAAGAVPGVGFTVTKATGNSPERNRIRRRLRAAVRKTGAPGPDFDFVILARRNILTMDFARLTHDIARAMSDASRRFGGGSNTTKAASPKSGD